MLRLLVKWQTVDNIVLTEWEIYKIIVPTLIMIGLYTCLRR